MIAGNRSDHTAKSGHSHQRGPGAVSRYFFVELRLRPRRHWRNILFRGEAFSASGALVLQTPERSRWGAGAAGSSPRSAADGLGESSQRESLELLPTLPETYQADSHVEPPDCMWRSGLALCSAPTGSRHVLESTVRRTCLALECHCYLSFILNTRRGEHDLTVSLRKIRPVLHSWRGGESLILSPCLIELLFQPFCADAGALRFVPQLTILPFRPCVEKIWT